MERLSLANKNSEKTNNPIRAGNKKALIESEHHLRQSGNITDEIVNKKALIKKKISFRQSLIKQLGTGKNFGNTGGVEENIGRFFIHPRAHPSPCLSSRIYSFRAVYKNSNRLSTSIFIFCETDVAMEESLF